MKMGSLAKTVFLKSALKSKVLSIPIRTLVDHNVWKPGPYPETEEEMAKAAEKYNMPRELYQPYPDDGAGYGDYPKLPVSAADGRDPFYPYDYPEYRRNYGETMSVDDAVYREDRFDASYKDAIPVWAKYAQFFGVMGISMAIFHYFQDKGKRFDNPWLEKQMPSSGVVHYTFEPAKK